jgi:hypothetical protein
MDDEQRKKYGYFNIEPKDKSKCKAIISNLDWSVDGRLVCACFKTENFQNVVTIWNINTCQKTFVFDGKDHDVGNINKAVFYPLSPDYLLISGDKALIIQISSGKKVMVAEDLVPQHQKIMKKKGSSLKSQNLILRAMFNQGIRYYLLIDNQSKLIFLMKDKSGKKPKP